MNAVLLVTVLVWGAPAWAQEPDAQADPAADAAVDTSIEIIEMKGKVDFRTPPEEAWQPLEPDSPLTIGSEVRTDFRSFVKLRVGANSDVEVKQLSKVAIGALEVDEESRAIRTRLAKEYGTMRVQVHQVGDLSNDYVVSTPSGVLAVRGTDWEHSEFGTTWQIREREGAIAHTTQTRTYLLLPGDETDSEAPDPNTPPTRKVLLAGDPGDELGREGGDILAIRDGVDSLHLSLGSAANLQPLDFDPGGEDTGGGGDSPGGGGNERGGGNLRRGDGLNIRINIGLNAAAGVRR